MLKGPPALVLQESEPVDLDAGGSQCGRRCLKKMRAKDDLKGLTDREESLDKKVDPVHTKPVQHISAASVNCASIQGELKTSNERVSTLERQPPAKLTKSGDPPRSRCDPDCDPTSCREGGGA